MKTNYQSKNWIICLLLIISSANSWSQTVSFTSPFIVTNENQGTINVTLNLVSPTTSSVTLVVKTTAFSTANSADFTLTTQTLNFTATSATTQTVTIPIIDDNLQEQQAEYFVLSLENPSGLTIGTNALTTIYIKDNDFNVPTALNSDITLDYIGSYDPSGAASSSCEIVVHDPISQRLFVISALTKKLDILNFSNPTSLSIVNSIDMTPYQGITSVAVKNGIVAVACPNANEQLNGSVVFFTIDGTFLKQLTVGALPDMITFTPDGSKVLTANEGQPNDTYTIDPEGSVSIIDISGGVAGLTQANVTTLFFDNYNTQEATLLASGIRKVKSTSTLSQDIEPEYITVSDNSQKAWVSLQENNAIAEINLATNSFSDIWALGTKDVSIPGNGMDISDTNGQVLIANWPIKAYYAPDAIANYTINGTTYLVTANEGDEKDYTGFTERSSISAGAYALDATVFPNASVLKSNNNAGRMRVTNVNGNTDGDAAFEEIYCIGSRSFSIFNTTTKSIVYDSGDDFEKYTALTPSTSTIFNADHTANNTSKVRSRAKGPEPEGVTVATMGGKTFAFITLERIGGVMVYDVTDPANGKFVEYKNSRNVSAYGGDNGPEGITFITAANSPTTKNYVVVANEISGTLSLFEVNTSNLSTDNYELEPKTFVIFPNPNETGMAYFNRMVNYELFDYTGKLVASKKDALTINTATLATGIYIVKTEEGITKKLVVK